MYAHHHPALYRSHGSPNISLKKPLRKSPSGSFSKITGRMRSICSAYTCLVGGRAGEWVRR